MAKYLTEFTGTFMLVLTIGAALMVMVYAGGHISGAHYNPAVSLAAVLRGALPASQLLPYMLAQIAGSLAAAALVLTITARTFAPAPAAEATALSAFLVEVIYTFALVLVVLNVAVSKRTTGNSYYGLAIGFAVLAGAFAGGGISGGAFNPAVGIGPIVIHALAGGGSFGNLWLYIAGPFAGAVLAATVYAFQEGSAG
jgi:aquaporin Z